MSDITNSNDAEKYFLMGRRCLERDDFYNATQYFKRAARLGHGEAKNWIETEEPDRRIEAENQYKFGLDAVTFKAEWAVPYMAKAAELGHEKAQAWLEDHKKQKIEKKKKRKKAKGKKRKKSTKESMPELQPGMGYIYVLINASLPKHYLKIGMTTRDPEVRAEELSNHSGVPGDYVVAHQKKTKDCKRVEELIHQKLEGFRLTGFRNDRQREFFVLPLHEAISAIDEICKSIDDIN
jgi:TPR repeat protein